MFLYPNLSNPSFRSFYRRKKTETFGWNSVASKRARLSASGKKVAMEHMQAAAAGPSYLRRSRQVLERWELFLLLLLLLWTGGLVCHT